MFKTSMAISPTPAVFAPLLFAGDWTSALDAAVDLGYDAIEISVRDPEDPAVVACDEGLRRRGLQLSAIATGQSFYSDGWSPTSDDPEVRRLLDERMLRIIELASPWEAMVVIGGVRGTLTGSDLDQEEQYERAVHAVGQYAAYGLSRDVSIVIEPINRYETNYINTIEEALRFIRDVGRDNLGVLADTFHMNIEEADLAKSLRSAGDRIRHVQFTDSNRLAAGRGHVNFPELAAVLREFGYRGYLSTETLPLPDSRTAAQQAIEYFRTL
jgi:sugar phosphate isomerase/epimerase